MNIGLCYLPVEKANTGQVIQVMIRNQAVDAEVIPTPFYKRASLSAASASGARARTICATSISTCPATVWW